MDNSYKALIMGASALMFVIAVSIAIYTYSTLMNTTDLILTTSEKFARATESFDVGVQDTTRTISAAEVVGTILNLTSKLDYTYEEVIVGTNTFTSGNVKSSNTAIKNILNDGGDYFILSEDYENRIIQYQKN